VQCHAGQAQVGQAVSVGPRVAEVGDHEPAAGAQHARGLADRRHPARLVGDVVDRQAAHHDVDRAGGER
jgi:hypothetical protein